MRIPPAGPGAAPQLDERDRVHAPAPGDAVLAVAREHHVARTQRVPGTDLRGLLAAQRRPEAHFALPLQGDGLGVEPPHQHHVAVHVGGLGNRDDGLVGVSHQLAGRREQLQHVAARCPFDVDHARLPTCCANRHW